MNVNNVLSGSLFALMLIVAGALLFLDNFGVLPIQDIHAYWPIFIVIFGVQILDTRRSRVGAIWALAVMAWGILLILGNLQVIHVNGSIFWPVMLIAFGISMLMRPMDVRDWREHVLRFQASVKQQQVTVSDDKPVTASLTLVYDHHRPHLVETPFFQSAF